MTWEENNYLVHYGIKGQKRGHRRFQNEDGSLTPEGKERYGVGDGDRRQRSSTEDYESGKRQKKELTPEEREARKKKVKKILAIAAGVTLAAAAGYMAYKIGDQWTKNLVDEYKFQAKAEESKWAHLREKERGIKRAALREAKDSSSALRSMSKNHPERDIYELKKNWGIMDARRYAHLQGESSRYADHYAKLGKNVTRLQAVKNFIENNGQIVVPPRYLY